MRIRGIIRRGAYNKEDRGLHPGPLWFLGHDPLRLPRDHSRIFASQFALHLAGSGATYVASAMPAW